MLGFIARRLLIAVPVLLGVSMLVFVSIHLIPGDTAQLLLGDKGTPEELARLRDELGLDLPIYVQYERFLVKAIQGDFGRSYRTRSPVSQDLRAAYPLTLELALGAMLLAIVVGIPAGVLAATKHNRLFDHAVMVTVLAGLSMPVFWTGILLIILLGVSLPLFPLSGVISDSVMLTNVTGFPLLDSIITGNAEAFFSVISHMVLPMITLGSVPMGLIARQTRSAMLEVLRDDYVRTARAKGLREWRVISGHAFKNGLIPVVTVMGLQFGSLLSGAVITETVFARPGLGRMAVTSILFRDYAAVQAVALVSAITFVVLNILVDLLYGAIDPRISRS